LVEHWQHIDELGLRQQLGATLTVAKDWCCRQTISD
jgi:hypothetical protein